MIDIYLNIIHLLQIVAKIWFPIGLSAISSDFHQNPECEAGKIIQIFSKMMKKIIFFVELEFINNYL